jgi:hypothetical protein
MRGSFWFIVIVVEVVVAFGVATVASNRQQSDQVSLDGADVGAFCAYVAQDRALAAAPSGGADDAASVAREDQAQVQALQQLIPVAPTDIREDLQHLADEAKKAAAAAQATATHAQRDPSWTGAAAEILAAQDAANASTADSNARFEAAVRQACGIDLSAPPATQPPGTTPGAPSGAGGTAPSGTAAR